MNRKFKKLKNGEAEELVKEMRGHLRLAQTHSQQGNTGAEAKELQASEIAFDRLMDGICKILEKYAGSCCSPILVEDLVQEMVIGVFKEVQHLEDTRHFTFYEENFIDALKYCLHNVVKTFRSEKACYNDSFTRAHLRQEKQRKQVAEGKREKTTDEQDVEVPLSLNAPIGEDEDASEQIDLIRDKQNLHAMENALTKEILQQLYAELSTSDRVLVEALFRGYSVEEAAAKAGIPPRTAFDHKRKIYKRVCELSGVATESGGTVDEAASEFAKPKARARARKRTPRVH